MSLNRCTKTLFFQRTTNRIIPTNTAVSTRMFVHILLQKKSHQKCWIWPNNGSCAYISFRVTQLKNPVLEPLKKSKSNFRATQKSKYCFGVTQKLKNLVFDPLKNSKSSFGATQELKIQFWRHSKTQKSSFRAIQKVKIQFSSYSKTQNLVYETLKNSTSSFWATQNYIKPVFKSLKNSKIRFSSHSKSQNPVFKPPKTHKFSFWVTQKINIQFSIHSKTQESSFQVTQKLNIQFLSHSKTKESSFRVNQKSTSTFWVTQKLNHPVFESLKNKVLWAQQCRWKCCGWVRFGFGGGVRVKKMAVGSGGVRNGKLKVAWGLGDIRKNVWIMMG